MGIIDYFGIQSLSRTSYAKLQNFQSPTALKMENFQGLSRNSGHPIN